MKFVLLESTGYEKISAKKAMMLLKHKQYIVPDTPIYRGLKGYGGFTLSDAFILKPEKGEDRRSRNTANYYTEIINNDPLWEKFPKREIVCSTNYNKALVYGPLFYVFPKPKIKIAICPQMDIWDTFEVNIDWFEDEWVKLLGHFRSPMRHLINAFHLKLREVGLRDDYKFIKKSKFYNLLLQTYNPNGFEIKYAKNKLKLPENREVWMDGECLLVYRTVWDDYKDKSKWDDIETFKNPK